MHRGRVGTGLGLGLGFRVRLCCVFLSEDEVFDLRITEDFYNRWTYKVPGNINFPGRPAVAQVLYAPNRNAIGSLPLFPRHPMSQTEMQWLCTAVTQAPCAPNRNAMGSVPLCPIPHTGAGHSGTRYSGPTA